MNEFRYRVNYFSLDDTWCRYFKTERHAINYLKQKQTEGYRATLTKLPDH